MRMPIRKVARASTHITTRRTPRVGPDWVTGRDRCSWVPRYAKMPARMKSTAANTMAALSAYGVQVPYCGMFPLSRQIERSRRKTTI